MSIETIGLGRVAYTDAKPRDYAFKYTALENARKGYIGDSVKLSNEALDRKLKVESESIVDVNKLNRNGQRAPEPNLSYHKSYNTGTVFAAIAQAERRIDIRA